MKQFLYPSRDQWARLLMRPLLDSGQLKEKVAGILQEVKASGDSALRKFTLQFDNIELDDFRQELITEVSPGEDLRLAIKVAYENIYKFHLQQLKKEEPVETMPGVVCWRRSVAIEKVGLYIPGGTAPLFSTVLMLAIPAKIAGCKEIILCTPPAKDGSIHPAIIYAASLAGVTAIFKVGGAQAIAAMAYGTESIPGVYKIFGPGNQYVNCAKQLIQLDGVSIDMPAGPSEVCVLADETANPAFIAADMLSQAEHGRDSQSLLITSSAELAKQVEENINRQLQVLSRRHFAQESLSSSKLIVMTSMQEAIAITNEYAAEHLIIATKDADHISERIYNAGSVFIGNYSPESVGDYASGTNHVLPTNGFAKAFSGVSVDSFLKKITYQRLTKAGLASISSSVQTMAKAEGLDGHANAVAIRLNNEYGL